jgi:hypothetical protein
MTKLTIKALLQSCPWQIAKDNRLEYSGDCNFIPHGGTFYETSNWEAYGYASCVRISESEGTLWVESGTINRPSKDCDLLAALQCSGFEFDNDNDLPGMVRQSGQESIELTPQIEIECLLGYWGAEVDSTETFQETENGFNEYQICKYLKTALLQIVPQL